MKIRIYTFTCALLLAITAYAQEYTDTIGTDDTLLPEGMQMYELDSLLTDWMTRTYLTNVENCLSKGVNPSFSDETYAQRLSRLPNVIDMPYNDIVRKYIDRYCERLRPSVSIMLGACNFYNPIFEEALESYQVPLELRNLPIIESALHPNAVSRAGAVGLWQFMIGTAKRYGLEVTSLIDERKDPVKASYAAAHMLKDLYDIFGDWSLAIAAYNCGPGNVSKAIRRSGGRKDFWGIYQYLPAETRGYVPAFIAANYVMNYYCDHNICPVGTTLPQATDTLLLKKNVKMEQIAATCDISIDELRARLFRSRELARKLVLNPDVVAVQKSGPRRARGFHAAVSGVGNAAVLRKRNDTDPCILFGEPRKHVRRTVVGAVVYDDHFDLADRLLQRRAHAAVQRCFAAIGGNDHADPRRHDDSSSKKTSESGSMSGPRYKRSPNAFLPPCVKKRNTRIAGFSSRVGFRVLPCSAAIRAIRSAVRTGCGSCGKKTPLFGSSRYDCSASHSVSIDAMLRRFSNAGTNGSRFVNRSSRR